MQKQLKLVLRPNNQVALFTQWVNTKSEERYLSCPDYSKQHEYIKEYYRNGSAKFDRERDKTHETIRVTKVKKDGTLAYSVLRVERVFSTVSSDRSKIFSPLDITEKSQRSVKHRAGWGFPNTPKKFTNKSGQKLRECGAMVDKLTDGRPELCRVITLTLPANTPDAFASLANYSGYIINRLFQPIRSASHVSAWFFVWEYQKRGALHLHICLYSEEQKLSCELGSALCSKWYSILDDVQLKSGVNMFADSESNSCRVQRYEAKCLNQEMRKSCGGYFSKYAAKGENSEENTYVRKFSKMYPPSRFWGSSQLIKDMCKKYSYTKLLAIEEHEIEAQKERILELVLLHNPVKFYEFDWRKKLYQDTDMEVVISEGHCDVFYLSPSNYELLLNALNSDGESI